MLEIIVITSLVISTLLLAFKKMGVLDWYEAHYGHIAYLPSSQCFFCLGFWMAGFIHFTLSLISLLVFHNVAEAGYFAIIPFCTAPISTLITHAITENL